MHQAIEGPARGDGRSRDRGGRNRTFFDVESCGILRIPGPAVHDPADRKIKHHVRGVEVF